MSCRGETSDNLDYHLMRAYSTVPIKEWESFADRLKDDFHNLVDNDPNRTPQYLMDKAENKFKTMINEGSWDSKLKEKDEFLALKAEFNKFKKKHQRKWTKVVTDSTSFEYNYHYDDVLSILELLSDSPRVLIQDEPYASDEYFMQQVAKHHAPVAQRIERDRAEQAVS